MSLTMRAPHNSSSHIHSMGYDEETGTLAIRFHKGGVYYYQGIDARTYGEMHAHESPGGYFHQNILGKFTGYKDDRRATK